MARYSGSGGTDGANMVMFWPENLPEEADTKLADDPLSFTETMREEGRVIWFLCEGNGDYAVSVYVDEEPSPQLREFLGDEEHYAQVQARGTAFFGGLEYLHKEKSELLDQYPTMCARLEIPNGMYQAHVFRTHIPPTFSRHWLMHRLGHKRYRVLHWQHLLSKASLIGAIGLALAFFFLTWPVRLGMIAAVALTFIGAVLLARSEACQEAIVAIDEFTEEFPEYVVILNSALPEGNEEPESAELAMPVA